MYRKGGMFSVTSKILVTDFLSQLCPGSELTAEGTVPVELITGLVVLHAET